MIKLCKIALTESYFTLSLFIPTIIGNKIINLVHFTSHNIESRWHYNWEISMFYLKAGLESNNFKL